MVDDHIKESYYLVTYEWLTLGRHSSDEWRRDNQVIKGCPGVWWSQHIAWYRNYEEAGREKAQEYENRGEKVPMSEVVNSTELRFISATPITKSGYDALGGIVG